MPITHWLDRTRQEESKRLTGYLMPVYSDAVQLRISVKKGAKLEKRIWAIFNTGDHAARRECSLFHVPMEVFGITG
jgi:hypothetical protein